MLAAPAKQLAAVLSALLLLSAQPASGAQLAEFDESLRLPDGTDVHFASVHGVPRWRLLPYLWYDKTVRVSCPGRKDFSVYVAHDQEALAARASEGDSVWCGWQRWAGGAPGVCQLRISPFGCTHIAVAGPRGRPSSPGVGCGLEVQEAASPALAAAMAAGAMLFLAAAPLSRSRAFRVGTGGVTFMLLSLLILAFAVSRFLPSRRSVAAAFALLGSTFATAVRVTFGHWVPSFRQLVYSNAALAYLAVWGLVGLAVTYYYDADDQQVTEALAEGRSPPAVRLRTILKYALKLAGLALVGIGTSLPEASAALCCALVAYEGLASARKQPAVRAAEAQAWAALAQVRRGGAHEGPGDPPEGPAGFSRRPAGVPAVAQSSSRVDGSGRGVGPESGHARAGDKLAAAAGKAVGGAEDGWAEWRDAFAAARAAPFLGESSGNAEDVQAVHAAAERGAQPGTPGAQPAQQARTRSSTPGMAPGGDAAQVSPLVQRGLILNERTGKAIKIGGATYNRLVLQDGFQVDRAAGTLTPPREGGAPSSGPSSPTARAARRRSTMGPG